jgi:hydroxymethylbilane synthase
VLDPAEFVPAIGQGCVAVECRQGDRSVRNAVAAIDDAATRSAVLVERAFLAELGSGCALPVGAHVEGRRLHTFLADADSGITAADRIDLSGELDDDIESARRAAREAHELVTTP